MEASHGTPLRPPASELAEAIRRVLPELRKLDRYERRAAAQRERAVLEFSHRMKFMDNPQLCYPAKRTQFLSIRPMA